MLIAARESFAAARGWRNPYVTDGLVAMWDGEWNAGGGVHDAAATTWVDLSGNGQTLERIDSDRNAPFTSHKYAEFLSNTSPMLLSGLSGDNPSFAAIQSGHSTVEIVADCATPVQDYPIFFAASANWGKRIFIVAASNNSAALGNYAVSCYMLKNATGAFNSTLSAQDANTRNRIVRLRYVLTSQNNVYIDDSFITSLSKGTTTIGTGEGILRIGAGSDTMRMRVYNERVYNKVLSAAEIAANYAIDKKRFLP